MSKKLTKTEVLRIKRLSSKGHSERDIANRIGCSRSAVWYHLKK